jgi:hypothetical protein
VEVTGPVRVVSGRESMGLARFSTAPRVDLTEMHDHRRIHDQVDTTGPGARSNTHDVDMTMERSTGADHQQGVVRVPFVW